MPPTIQLEKFQLLYFCFFVSFLSFQHNKKMKLSLLLLNLAFIPALFAASNDVPEIEEGQSLNIQVAGIYNKS